MDTRTARRLLEGERMRLQRLLEAATASEDAVSLAAAAPGDSADVGGRIIEREIAESFHVHAKRGLREVDAAFARIADNRFGVCDVCGGPIGRERLKVLPATRACVTHAAVDVGAAVD